MNRLLCLCAAILLTACSTSPEMEGVAARVQKARMDNALYARAARIRVWKDTSKESKQGWYIHSEQENKFTLPENEFKTARYLVITHGYTAWSRRQAATLEAYPKHVIELEWIDAQGNTKGGIDLTRLNRESQFSELTAADFPFVLPDEACQQFFALPTIHRAFEVVSE
ncbi:MAG: hypothetical protein IJN23_07905 [Akkermansia sp.]|nr:hypothetical protein [Akkermansia sp.]